MSHVRTQIRSAFKAALDAGLGNEYDVYSSRKSAINHDPEKVVIDIRFGNDQTSQKETMSDARIHVASLYVRVQRSAREEELDDLLDSDEVSVINSVEAHDWGSLLEENPEAVQTNWSGDGDTGYILGSIIIRFDLEYRINRDDPETVIQ